MANAQGNEMEQSLQGTRPHEACIERRGQDGPGLLLAHACQQKALHTPACKPLRPVRTEQRPMTGFCWEEALQTLDGCLRFAARTPWERKIQLHQQHNSESFSHSSQADRQRK
jgi:hypothetical protein